MKCPFCSASTGRCATTTTGRSITECTSCGRVIEERQSQNHHLFHLRAQDTPLGLVTSDLPTVPHHHNRATEDEDPFEHTGFITAFSTWSLEHSPLFARSSLSFSGYLAELERTLEVASSGSSTTSSSTNVVVDNLRAYLQIIDVASILKLDCDISDHAFRLFRDCCSATCLRNRSVEGLATACLVQAIREAQEPRTLQEISNAANVPQKEIGKYIKILGEALQLSQPMNSNSISVHMPRFCMLLQLNKSAQELATHIGEVVVNKCFCTRRNPISISAAAIYLACQLEDKRKTQSEICKVTGLTEVTLRKVYKELLENWDDLLPSNYTPAVPPEKAFPTTTISTASRPPILLEVAKPTNDIMDTTYQAKGKEDGENNSNINRQPSFRQPWLQFSHTDNGQIQRHREHETKPSVQDFDQRIDKQQSLDKEIKATSNSMTYLRPNQFTSAPNSSVSTITWQFRPTTTPGSSTNVVPVVHPPKLPPGYAELRGGTRGQNGSKVANQHGDN